MSSVSSGPVYQRHPSKPNERPPVSLDTPIGQLPYSVHLVLEKLNNSNAIRDNDWTGLAMKICKYLIIVSILYIVSKSHTT